MEKQRLKDLKLEWTADAERFVDDKMLLQKLVPPSTLKTLEMCGYGGVSFPAWLVGELPILERLVLRGMAHLVEWNTSYSSGDDHVIKCLEIQDCPKLRIEPFPPRAEVLRISNSDNVLSSWEECTVLHTNASSYSPVNTWMFVQRCKVPLHQWRLLQHLSNLTYLSIHNCGDLTGSIETSQHLSFVNTLWLGDGDLEETPKWIGELTSLQDLSLSRWKGLKGLNDNMRPLTKLEIHDCPMLRMKQLPPKAKSWVISKSDNVLSSWDECTVSDTNASTLSFPVTKLSVENCKVPLHQWRSLQHLPLPGLSWLSIKGCSDLTGSLEISRHLSSIETLCLEHKHSEELPTWIGDLTSLQVLEITGWLKGFSENMRPLTKLRSLKLSRCYIMASLPHWLGELASLKELTISGCPALRSLPESTQQLTGLQKLEIGHCPKLNHVVESQEGKMKLTDNQERVCLLPISLEELQISYCAGIKSLPEGIEQLTNLQLLRICNCSELKQWCELEENNMKLAHIANKRIT